ncbi:hypothetical protein RHCRD62_30714 [Rhodococcus sp. RD6.2]|nr:hypothetical protein RHCRD62_30714 [Rhodococcus sp. RD6.2]
MPAAERAGLWPAEQRARLDEIRRRHDPNGVLFPLDSALDARADV